MSNRSIEAGNRPDIPRTKETTFMSQLTPRELGWRPSSPKTGLMDSSMDVRMIPGKNGRDATYLVAFPPVKGDWMAQVLTAATSEPNHFIAIKLVIDPDMDLFERVRTDPDKRLFTGMTQAELLNMHKKDPVIGETMTYFGEHHEDKWRKALLDSDVVLRKAFRQIKFVDMDFFPDSAIEEASQDPKRYEKEWYSSNSYINYEAFLKSVGRNTNVQDVYRKHTPEEFREYWNWVRTVVGPGEVQSFVSARLEDEGNILVDVTSQEVSESHIWRENEKPSYTLSVDDETFSIQNDTTTAVLKLNATGDQARPYAIESQTILLDPTNNTNQLKPVVAWRQRIGQDGQTVEREFLTADEIQEQFGDVAQGEDLDDYLGIVALAGFQPSILRRVPKKMHLRQEREQTRKKGGQGMEATQIGVYHNLQERREEMLTDPDGVLGSVERLAAAA
ncbi:MAG TPA: hypothetical protein VLF93_07050 [Candidatus Saccharimonadales bacterium]|nr:hypothetical protein [Candidatus Saccharimonadales bacterium]